MSSKRQEPKPASQAEIDAAIEWYDRGATAAAKERGALLLRAFGIVDACKNPGEKMAAYTVAARECHIDESTVRAAFAKGCRFPEYARLAALTPRWGRAERRRFVDTIPGLADFIGGVIIERSNLVRIAVVARLALLKFGLDSKHRSAIEGWIRDFRGQNRASLLIATNPDAAKSRLLPAHGSRSAGVEPLDLVELDGSPADALVVDTPSGRCRILTMIDVASRRAVAIVAEAESTQEAGRLFAKFVTEVGLMRAIRTDRGAGFISTRMRALCDRMLIDIEIVAAFSGYLKPFVEALVRIIQQFLELEAGYGGHNVGDRVQCRGRLSMSERRGKSEKQILRVAHTKGALEDRINQFLALEADRPRDELGGRTSNQVIADWQARGGLLRRVQDPEALWQLLAPGGIATIGKKGIQVEGRLFVATEFARLQGQRIEWRRHPDTGKLVIYSADRIPRFLFVANCVDVMDEAERQAEAMAARGEFRVYSRQIRAAARQLARKVGGNPAEILLSAKSPTGETKIVPIRTVGPPALVEAGKAARAIAAEADEPAAPAMPSFEEARVRYLRLRRKAPEALSERESQFVALFRYQHPGIDDDLEEAAS
jgi:Integrase core domain